MNTSIRSMRFKILISCFLAMFFAGTLYSWSIFVPSFEEEFGWARSQTSLTYSLMISFNTGLGVLSAFLSRKLSFRSLIRVGAGMGLAGLLLVANVQSLWQLYLGFGILFGGGMGFVYNSCCASIVRWFPDNPGGYSGVLLMAYGFATMVLGPLYNAGIEQFGWRRLFLLLAVVCAVLLTGCSMFNRMPAAGEERLLPNPRLRGGSGGERSLAPREMLRTPQFWMYSVWQILLAACGMTLSGHAAPLAQEAGASAALAAFFVGLQSGGSGVGRVLFGFIFDRIGRKTLYLVNAFPIAGSLLLLLSYRQGLIPLMAAAFLLLGIGFGGSPVSSAGYTKYTFGPLYYAMNLSIVNLSVLVASFAGPYIGGLVYEKSGYGMVCVMMLVFALLGVCAAVPTVRSKGIND